MKISVELIGLPTLSSRMGKKIDVELLGETVMDLITQLAQRFGPEVRKLLLDSSGNLDHSIQAMVNDTGFLPREAHSRKTLEDGDTVKFVLLAAGG